MKKPIALSAVLCVCLHAEIFTLGVVEVTAKDEGLSAPNVSVVNKKTMQLNNAKTVSDIAKLTSGVSLRGGAYARNETSISIRGLSSTQIPVYIDGIPVYVPYDGNMDLSRFTTYDLSRIDISKGASSLLYGPNALGGAINIISLKPTRELEASLGYGARTGKDSGTLTNIVDARVATKQELFYVQANGSFVENNGNPMTSNHDFVKDHSHVESRDKKVGLKLGFTPTDSDEYVISYSKQEGEKTGRLYEGRDKTDFFSDSYWYWPQWNKESIYFLSNTDFNNWYIKSKAYYDRFKNSLHNMSDSNFNKSAPGKRGFKSKYNDYTYGFGLEAGANIGENNILKFAPSYKRDVHRESDIDVPVQRYEDETLSLALEHTYFFSERTNLTTGASYDLRKAIKAQHYGVPAWESDPRAKKRLYEHPTKKDGSFNYQAIFKHGFTDSDELMLSFAKKTRFPTIKDRYSFRFGRFIPNPDLKAEEAYHYEVGYSKKFGDDFRLNTAIFYSDIRKKFESVVVETKPNKIAQFQNIGNSDIYGFEFEAHANLADNLKMGANYTYMHADSGKEGVYLTNIPKHKGFLYADLKIAPKFSFYLSQEAETGRQSNSDGTFKPGGFIVTNVKFIANITKNLNIDVGIDNLFDKAYEYTEGFFGDGRTFFANIRYDF